jgi:UDP-N-acetylglucosamine--N-acetylmuramyl-(pentapeptide) pyrophosphoryl-undecaprenol N-acetylglucosamine transferase
MVTPRKCNIAIAAGGTGGHIFPGIAVAQALGKMGIKKVVFIGKKGGLEEDIINCYGFSFYGIHTAGLVGKGLWEKIKGLSKMVIGLKEALNVLKREKIDLLLAMGSYVAVPAVIAARYLHMPVVLHEQNAVPGKANQVLSRWAKVICVSYESSKQYFRGKNCIFTGNPVRAEILKVASFRNNSNQGVATKVLILGGSQGARAINKAFCGAWPFLKKHKERFYFIHQTGHKDFAWIKAFYDKEKIPGEVHAFIYEMEKVYPQVDLVIARAGATTLAELMVVGLPSILIPFPGAIGHQRYNALALEKAGAALVITQDKLNGKLLARQLLALQKDPPKLRLMAKAALSLGKRDAAQRIAQICVSLVHH